MSIYNLELYILTFAKVFFKLLEPKRMQVFPLKLQYQNILIDLFKQRSLKTYDFYMMSNSTCYTPCEPIKIQKLYQKQSNR